MARNKTSLAAAVGLDIGSDTIKVVEAKAGKGGPRISGIGIAQLPDGLIDNSVIVDPVGLGQAIKALLAESGIKTKPVISAVAGQSSVVVRVIEVPRMTRQELAETMKFEVERHVPFSPHEVIMDFEPIERPNDPPDGQNMQVLLAVAQQDVVNNHVETLFAAGLAPKAIDVEPLAASRALIELDEGAARHQTIAIVDMGANNTDLGIFEGGLLVFACPPLQIAGTTFTRAISEYLQVPMDEAEGLKKQFAAVDPSKMNAGPAPDYTAVSDSPFGGYDAEEPTVSGPPPQMGFDPGPVPEQPQSDFKSPFDFGEGTGEPVPAPEPQVPQPDVFDLGSNEDAPQIKPTFDLGDDLAIGGEPPTAEPEIGMGAAPTGLYDLDGQVDAIGEPQAVVPVAPQHTSGLGDRETKERVAEAVAPVLMDLAAELRQSLGYYQSNYGMLPEKVVLSGGAAKMRGIDRYLEEELGLPVQVADPFANVSVSSARYSEQYLKEISPLFTVSVGLAVREMLGE